MAVISPCFSNAGHMIIIVASAHCQTFALKTAERVLTDISISKKKKKKLT